MSYLAQIPRVVGDVLRNPDLRRVQLAFVGFNAAEWGAWIAMLVYAYGRGGATTAGLVAFAQLVPACLFAPFAAALADRRPPARVLTFGYVAQATTFGATAAALLSGAPPLLAYALAASATTAVTITRPTQAALLPALARAPQELTAANVVAGWIESASIIAGPALAGVLLAVGSPGAAFAAMAALVAASAILTAPVRGPAAACSGAGGLAATGAGFRALARAREPRVLVGVLAAQYIAIGALDVLYVVLAVSVLHIGGSGAGYLNAAFGAGGVAAIAATAALVGRKRLAPSLVLAAGVWLVAFVALGLWPSVVGAFLLLAVAGSGRTVVDVAGRTLLQRIAPADLLGRVFGVLEGLSMAGLAVGSLLTPALVAGIGSHAAIICIGAVLPLCALLSLRSLLHVDVHAHVPVVELGLLRSVPLFAPLGAPELEALARALVPVDEPAGTEIVRQGEPGDRYYVVADGQLEVVGRTLQRGDGFGEIALLRRVPRTATVTATTDVRLYSLAADPFLQAVTGHAAVAREAERVASERLQRVPA